MQCDNRHTHTKIHIWILTVLKLYIKYACGHQRGKPLNIPKMKFIQQKNKNVFQRWNQKAAPGRTLRTLKTSCKVFRGDVFVCVCVCATLCALSIYICVCVHCMLCVWLGKYFGRILISSKLLYILLDRTHFATIKYYMKNEKRKTDDIKNGATRNTHTRTHIDTLELLLSS